MVTFPLQQTLIKPGFARYTPFQHFAADVFPTLHPIDWLNSHFAVGGWSPLQRLSGMLTAHMTRIAPRNGFTWHPHRGLEIYTWMLEGTLHHEDSTGGEGDLQKGDLQRMYSGDYIEHQELNLADEPVRVIQIWYIADRQHRGLAPHYQQIGREGLPSQTVGGATVYRLIGDGSPMESHMTGRLTATTVQGNGQVEIEAPRPDEDLFLYVTDGGCQVNYDGRPMRVGQYDVILGTPDIRETLLQADAGGLDYLSFYLPRFLS